MKMLLLLGLILLMGCVEESPTFPSVATTNSIEISNGSTTFIDAYSTSWHRENGKLVIEFVSPSLLEGTEKSELKKEKETYCTTDLNTDPKKFAWCGG